MAFGTLAVSDLVRTSNQNILDFGEERLFEYIGLLLKAYNEISMDMLGEFVIPVTDRIMGYGGSSGLKMVKADEFGRADTSKPAAGNNMGFPLELNQISVQWTRKWLQNHYPNEMVAIMQDAMLVDGQMRQNTIKNALFNPANRTFIDYLVDNYSLGVKALANADGFSLPPDPYGNTFNGSTHTHYLARVSTLAASDIDAVINTVAEHYAVGKVQLLINSAQESAIRGFNSTGQFIALQPVAYNLGANAAVAIGDLDTTQTNNRRIGYWGSQAAEVWVKPWIPASYMAAVMTNNGSKTLGYRERGEGGLHIAVQDEAYPLRTETMEAEYGLGVYDRVCAACLFVGGTSYTWTDL